MPPTPKPAYDGGTQPPAPAVCSGAGCCSPHLEMDPPQSVGPATTPRGGTLLLSVGPGSGLTILYSSWSSVALTALSITCQTSWSSLFSFQMPNAVPSRSGWLRYRRC